MSKNDDLVRPAQTSVRDHIRTIAARLVEGDRQLTIVHPLPSIGTSYYPPEIAKEVGELLSDAIERGAAQGIVTDEMVDRAAEAARGHLEIDGDNEGPFIRFDSIENAMRAALEAAFAATPPAPAPDAGELREAAYRIWPYLKWTISEESPGHHPTMPSAVAAFEQAFGLSKDDMRTRLSSTPSPTPQPPAVEAGAENPEQKPKCGKPGCGALKLLGKPCTDWDCPQQWVHHSDHQAVIKAKTDEIERLRRERRWTIERDGELLRVCRGDHDKAEKCEWETFVPASRLEAAEASNKALREIVPNLDHVISWLENGCDRQAAAQELRIYQSRARTLLSEQDGGADV